MRRGKTLMLDRNALAAIKALNDGGFSRHREQLESIDHPSNFVSPLFSVVEGNKGKLRSPESLTECLLNETRAAAKFFKRARTDADFLQETSDLPQILLNDLEARSLRSLPFVAAARAALPHVQKKAEAPQQYDRIMDVVREHRLQPADPVALCAIACALGHDMARRVFNVNRAPQEKDDFNTLADLEQVRLLNYLRHLSPMSRPPPKYELMTFDRGLAGFASLISVRNSISFSDSTSESDLIQYEIDGARLLAQLPYVDERRGLRELVTKDLRGGY